MRSRSWEIVLMVVGFGCLLPPCAAQTRRYSLTPVYGGELNNRGQVVGSSGSGLLVQDASGTWELLVWPFAQTLEAFGINERGDIVGAYSSAASAYRAFLYDATRREFRDIGDFGGNWSVATALNSASLVAGYAFSTTNSLAFTYDGKTMAPLPGLPPDSYSYALDINNRGDVVGQVHITGFMRAFHYDATNSLFSILDAPEGWQSVAYAINDGGEIAADWIAVGSRLGVVYTRTGVLTIPDFGGHLSVADINNAGTVVGSANDATGQAHAFLYRNGVTQDLNTLIDPTSGITLTAALRVNDAGEILAVAGNTIYLLRPAR